MASSASSCTSSSSSNSKSSLASWKSLDSRESPSSPKRPKQRLNHRETVASGKQPKRVLRTRIINNELLGYTTRAMIFGHKRSDHPMTRVSSRATASWYNLSETFEFGSEHLSNLACSLQRSLYCTPIDLQYSFKKNEANEYDLHSGLSIWYIPQASTFTWPSEFTTQYDWQYENEYIEAVGPLHRELRQTLLVHLLPSRESDDFNQDDFDCSQRLMPHYTQYQNLYVPDVDAEGRRQFEDDNHKACRLAVMAYERCRSRCIYPAQPVLLVMRSNQHLCRLFTQVYCSLTVTPHDAPHIASEFAFDQALLLRTGLAQSTYDDQNRPLQGAFDWPYVTERRSSSELARLAARVCKAANLPWNDETRIYGSSRRCPQQVDPWAHCSRTFNARVAAFNSYALFVLQQCAALPESYDQQVPDSSLHLGQSIQSGLTRFDPAAQMLNTILCRWPSLWGEVWQSLRCKKNVTEDRLKACVYSNFANPWLEGIDSFDVADQLHIKFPKRPDTKGPMSHMNKYWNYLDFRPAGGSPFFLNMCLAETEFNDPMSAILPTPLAPVVTAVVRDVEQDLSMPDVVLPPLQDFVATSAVADDNQDDLQPQQVDAFQDQDHQLMSPLGLESPHWRPCGHIEGDLFNPCCCNPGSCPHLDDEHSPDCCWNISADHGHSGDVDGGGGGGMAVSRCSMFSPLAAATFQHNSASPLQFHGLEAAAPPTPLPLPLPESIELSPLRASSPGFALELPPTPEAMLLQLKIDSMPSPSMSIVQPSSKSPTSEATEGKRSGIMSTFIANGLPDAVVVKPGDFVVHAGLACYINHSRYVITEVKPLSVTVAQLWLTPEEQFEFGKEEMVQHPNGVMPIGPLSQYETQLFWLPSTISQVDVRGYQKNGYLHRSSPPASVVAAAALATRHSPLSSPAAQQCARVRQLRSLWPQSEPLHKPRSANVLVPPSMRSMASAF